jgi:glycosyltransferase involved in cell wall biosynthesis
MRVLVFTDPEVSSIMDALLPFVSARIKQVNWHYRFIPDSAAYACLRITYRTMEGFYWVIRVVREIYRFRAGVIIAQYAYFCGLIGALAAKLARKPFIVRAVGSDLRVHSQSLMGKVAVLLTFRIASGVICVSKDLENVAQRLGAKSTVVIPSPLMLPYSNEINVRRKDRQIVSVARLVPIKGLSYLIRAMVHVKDGSLVIIGDGPERRRLELLSRHLELSDRVFFTGWIGERSTILKYLRQAAVFVLPSLSEGRPRVLIEAMACGLPVVATNVGGVPEVVVDGVNGLLVPPRDEKALAKAIERVFNDVEFQKGASAENVRAATEYLPSIIGQRIFDYLEKILHSAN